MKKAINYSLSDNQKYWLNRLNAEGYHAIVCYGFDEARAAVDAYLAELLA